MFYSGPYSSQRAKRTLDNLCPSNKALTIASFWGLHGMPILCGKRLSEIRQGIHKDLLEMLSGILQKLLILVPMDL